MADTIEDVAHVEVESRAQWRAWLSEHHASADRVWLVTYKKHCGDRYLPWSDIVREAICFGWIDSRSRRVDADRTKVYVCPRKPGSPWSAVNKRLVAELEEHELLAPAGRAAIEAARADGSWTFLDDVEALIEPADLREALDARRKARAGWDAAPPNLRKRALTEIKLAKTEATRRRRIDKVVERCASGEPPV